MFFTKMDLTLSPSYFDINDLWCNQGDGYFNLEEISGKFPTYRDYNIMEINIFTFATI